MQDLNFPKYEFKFRKKDDKLLIFDEVRKKYLVLTPEEWVRQNLIQFLIHEKQVPMGLIAIEKGLKVNTLTKRTDILVYRKDGQPGLLVECKAPTVKITQDVFEQIARYNMSLNVPLLIVSNGIRHYCCKIDFEKGMFSFMKEIPNYKDI